MSSLKYAAIRTVFEVLAASRLTGLVRRFSSARGLIFTLHRVLPETPAAFSPNAILQVRPDFLDFTIARIREIGFDIVDLDEAIRRLGTTGKGRPFAVFTFDDGYRDNLVHALPIMRRHKAPFTLYVPTALVDRTGEIWWQAIEDIITRHDVIEFSDEGVTQRVPAATLAEKQAAYSTIYWRMRKMPEPARVALIRALAARYGYDLAAQCRDLIMDWSELQTFADEPLCTIGAHTVRHYELAKLPIDEARSEIVQSVDILKDRFGVAPTHLSFPLGGPTSAGQREYALAKELGLASALTTIPGGLYARHKDELHSLPRVSLNGLFQERRYVDVFATPAVFR